jgi:hypothetical protein
VQFRTDSGENDHVPSNLEYVHIHGNMHSPRYNTDNQSVCQPTPARSFTAQLDHAVNNLSNEYTGIHDIVRQAIADAEDIEPEKIFSR